MKNSMLVFLWCVLTSGTVFSQNNAIPFMDVSLNMDGQLDEEVWGQLPSYSDFNNFYPDDLGKANNETEVKLFHNGVSLYISAIYYDTTNTSMVSSLKRDDFGGIVIGSDNFQVVIDPYNKQSNGYFFSVNASNAQLDGLISFSDTGYNMNESWSSVWQSETTTDGNNKIYKIEIPLKILDFDVRNTAWALNFIIRDSKANNWMTWTDMSRNYIQHDLRTTEPFNIEDLPKKNASKFIFVPSLSYNHLSDAKSKLSESNLKVSVDGQLKITSSLKMDATINPDFSQIDVDQQVTNLTRFAINFPERRNFFIENSDLFTNLGTEEVNPFYSRRIGSSSNILFGLKLSGNVAAETRIGILDVQTDKGGGEHSQNYGAFVLQQQLSKQFTSTVFVVNRQEINRKEEHSNYNRATGVNINYRSVNNNWTGSANLGKSFSEDIDGKNSFYNVGMNYSTKELQGNISYMNVGVNYLTDVGFTPRLYNYDALNDVVVREGFSRTKAELLFFSYPQESKSIQTIRFYPSNTTYYDEMGRVTQSLSFYNQRISFKNTSLVYLNLNHKFVDLKYAFDPLGNGNYISPNSYNYGAARLGYSSANNRRFSFDTGLEYGSYYTGELSRYYINTAYLFLPIAKLGFDYELNYLNLNELGKEPFHLAQFTGEVFFSNLLNWTTYIQYNTQRNNLNINSRLQWEYKPLSYLYLVVSDNYNQDLYRTNWGVAFKLNYRFDI